MTSAFGDLRFCTVRKSENEQMPNQTKMGRFARSPPSLKVRGVNVVGRRPRRHDSEQMKAMSGFKFAVAERRRQRRHDRRAFPNNWAMVPEANRFADQLPLAHPDTEAGESRTGARRNNNPAIVRRLLLNVP